MDTTTLQQSGDDHRPAVMVSVETGSAEPRAFRSTDEFTIGRGSGCALRVTDDVVSRTHCRVAWDHGQWWIEDLQSANGLYCRGHQFWRLAVENEMVIHLGVVGPALRFRLERSPAAHDPAGTEDIDHFKSPYFDPKSGPAGEHTMMVRQAYAQIQQKQKRFYYGVIGIVMVMLLISVGYAFYRHAQYSKQQQLAADIFLKPGNRCHTS